MIANIGYSIGLKHIKIQRCTAENLIRSIDNHTIKTSCQKLASTIAPKIPVPSCSPHVPPSPTSPAPQQATPHLVVGHHLTWVPNLGGAGKNEDLIGDGHPKSTKTYGVSMENSSNIIGWGIVMDCPASHIWLPDFFLAEGRKTSWYMIETTEIHWVFLFDTHWLRKLLDS